MTIKEIRTKYRLTQQKMSDLTGIPRRTIQNWEGGQNECAPYIPQMVDTLLEALLKGERES